MSRKKRRQSDLSTIRRLGRKTRVVRRRLPQSHSVGGGRIVDDVIYYVDAISGNDSNTGRSPAQAFKTISKVNGYTFKPGDRVLFNCGDTWAGTKFIPGVSGTKGRPIIFSKYGTGPNPVFSNTGHDAFWVGDKNYLTFDSLTITDCDNGINLDASTYCIVSNCEIHTNGQAYDGILLRDGSHHCVIEANNIHDIGSGGTGDGVRVEASTDNIIRYNTITTTEKRGISMQTASTGTEVRGNTITLATYSLIECNDSDECIFADNVVSESDRGIYLATAVDCIIEDNNITGVDKFGWY